MAKFGALILLVWTLQSACHHASTSGAATAATGPSSVTSDERDQALAAIVAAMPSSTVDVNTYQAQVLAAMKAQPQIAVAGVDPAGSIWAYFTDGVPLVIFLDRPNETPGTAARALTASLSTPKLDLGEPSNTPAGTTIRLINYFADQSVANYLNSFGAKYYYQNPISATGAALTDFRNFTNVGVGFMMTHGTYELALECYDLTASPPSPIAGCNTTRFYYLTASPRDKTSEQTGKPDPFLQDDWNNHRLGYGVDGENKQLGILYTVNADFVSDYWTFANNSLLYNSVCFSYQNDIMAATAKKNLSAFAGWTLAVTDSIGDPGGEYLIDQLLGFNTVAPETPKQRPFPLLDVYANMQANHPEFSSDASATDAQGNPATSTLQVAATAGGFGLLAPSISYMDVNENSHELTIHGAFDAAEPPNSSVTINKQKAAIQSWANDQVIVTLPSATGWSGPVQVISNNHPGNTVPLTEWESTFTFSQDYATDGVHETGSYSSQVVMTLNFRADVHAFRPQPHATPKPTTSVTFRAADYSQFVFTGSGSVVGLPPSGCGGAGNNCTGTLSCTAGASLIYNTGIDYGLPGGYLFQGALTPTNKQMTLTFYWFAVLAPCIITGSYGAGPYPLAPNPAVLPIPMPVSVIPLVLTTPGLPGATLTMDSTWTLAAGSLKPYSKTETSNPYGTLSQTLTWTAMAPLPGTAPPSDGSEDIGK